ncbi:MAG TPA: MBL fold metallo-hydrolase [Vicinamibacterales bacterium]|jgi:glyoxylase-like metal-dependent hydrolase (beta-lactamase superfamily II)|nr:MBL fold metallo-hydrolase [Vicinamibacterales bacterium]
MHLTRRDFVVLSSLGFVGSLGDRWVFAQAPAQAPTVPEFKDVRRNVGVFTARGGTIGYLVTPDAVVVVDSQFADTAPMFLKGLQPKTSRKIDFLINSHHHPDHTGGNKAMQPNVGKIVAHVNVPGLQKKQAAQQKAEENQAYADTTFDKDWKTSVGKETVSARHYGPGHTGGDIAIFFESANIVHMGDLMSYQRNPRADRPAGASIVNWVKVLENVVKDHNNDTIYIFGHSKVGERVTGSGKDLLELRDYFSAMLDFAKKQIASGKSQEEIVKGTQAIPGFERYEGTPTALEAAYLELTGKG